MSDSVELCWHCHDVLLDVAPPHCDRCPPFDECDLLHCRQPGCSTGGIARALEARLGYESPSLESRHALALASDAIREHVLPHWRGAAIADMLERMAWRPCCGNCRGENLAAHAPPKPFAGEGVTRYWVCGDCGAHWDGAELTAAEIADRPTRPPPPPPDAAAPAQVAPLAAEPDEARGVGALGDPVREKGD